MTVHSETRQTPAWPPHSDLFVVCRHEAPEGFYGIAAFRHYSDARDFAGISGSGHIVNFYSASMWQKGFGLRVLFGEWSHGN